MSYPYYNCQVQRKCTPLRVFKGPTGPTGASSSVGSMNAFSAQISPSFAINSFTTANSASMNFNVLYNYGNNFLNGVFTVPISGIYSIKIIVNYANQGTSGYL